MGGGLYGSFVDGFICFANSGFAIYEEMKKMQQFLLTAPIEDVAEFMNTLPPRIRSGEVQYKPPRRPEPTSRGATMWSEAGLLVT
tara:strand:+ start:359 stop:613 length:255 start_codon:yes stop_codon:yes gene_type:complete